MHTLLLLRWRHPVTAIALPPRHDDDQLTYDQLFTAAWATTSIIRRRSAFALCGHQRV